jgi:hypothetical protein
MARKTAREARAAASKTTKQAKGRQFRVDEIRHQMSKDCPEKLQEFERLCKFRASITTLHQYLKDQGYELHYSSVWQWWYATYPVGDEAKKVNALALAYDGIDTDSLLRMALAQSIFTLDEVRQKITEKTLEELKPQVLLGALPPLLREIRALTEQINNRQYIQDQQELERSGAYTVLAELELTFKDTAFEQPLRDAKRGALAKLEGR